ncbi:hypothetical protein MLD38_027775 [Melastoma candidum]|uniref:Uncharacterized protein n=1 Tax=Melastoma candidum TaxID=119954 RepID=A0ACB9P5D8_9MYRT|nr:hypothetical protein MLD38_027775 [Melastoma candidum]
MSFHLEENGAERGVDSSNGICDQDAQCREDHDSEATYIGNDRHDVFELKQGSFADLTGTKIMELIKSNCLDNASSKSLFSVASRILDECVERGNTDISHRMACLLGKVLNIIERQMSAQAENCRNQNSLIKSREEKFQSRIEVLETFAQGVSEENEVALRNLERMKAVKTELEEERKVEERDMLKMKKDMDDTNAEVSMLKQELELAQRMHEKQHLELEAESSKTVALLEAKVKELERNLEDSRKKVIELEEFSLNKRHRWKRKEHKYQGLIEFQVGALQGLRITSESMRKEVLKARRRHSEELHYLGVKLKGETYNEIQELKGNIRVYCRIRPFLPGQSVRQTTIDYLGENGELVVANPSKHGKEGHRLFKFNKVFGPATSQEEVYLDTQPLIRSVLDGYNVCIFAYGQTGSGKTYTMSGPNISSEEQWGVNYRALHDLFQIAQDRKNSIQYEVAVQMVEIYNEQVRDLLSSDGSRKRLGIWTSTQPNGLAVPDASIHSVKSTGDVLELMKLGLANRAIGATALNERSSRSHSVLTVHVRGFDLKSEDVLSASLHLVDLAGSERVDRSEVTGERLREAQHINKSLSALGDVIFALAQKSPHVPYRNSKLTQVLQSSLGGQAKTLMFVQLNPDTDSYSETISTLKFAERVSGVELGAAKSNREGREVRELMEQVASLKDVVSRKDSEIERLKSLKVTPIGEKRSSSTSLRLGSSSPRRHSLGTPQPSRILRMSSLSDKAASDGDNYSEDSDRHSDVGPRHSVDGLGLAGDFHPPLSMVGMALGQDNTDDVELLGLGDENSEEMLSDISDSGLSMGTETDGSIGSVVEYTLFPETVKPAEKSANLEKPAVPSKLPKPPQNPPQPSRLTRSTAKVPSSSRKSIAGASFSARPSKRWQ